MRALIFLLLLIVNSVYGCRFLNETIYPKSYIYQKRMPTPITLSFDIISETEPFNVYLLTFEQFQKFASVEPFLYIEEFSRINTKHAQLLKQTIFSETDETEYFVLMFMNISREKKIRLTGQYCIRSGDSSFLQQYAKKINPNALFILIIWAILSFLVGFSFLYTKLCRNTIPPIKSDKSEN